MIWIVIALVVGVAAAYIVWPLRRNTRANLDIEYSMSESHFSVTDADESLSQLDFDYSLGKINDEEYASSRAAYQAQLPNESAQNASETGSVATSTVEEFDAEIEAEILVARARRQKRAMQTASWMCEKCGRTMKDDDRFCASCGAARVADTVNM